MNLTSGLVEERERVSRREGGTGKQSRVGGVVVSSKLVCWKEKKAGVCSKSVGAIP